MVICTVTLNTQTLVSVEQLSFCSQLFASMNIELLHPGLIDDVLDDRCRNLLNCLILQVL